MKMPFGKYKGSDVDKLPKSYLKWLWEQDWVMPNLRAAVHSASYKYEITKQHKGWVGWYNPITGEGGSR